MISAASIVGAVDNVIPLLVAPYKWREFRIFYSLKYSQFVFIYKRLQLIAFM
jgi:hypothetical protein